MKLKKLLMLCLCASSFSVATVNAETLENVLVITLKDNSVNKYFLSDKPELKFSDLNLTVTSSDAEVSYPILNILDAKYIKGDKSGVDGVSADVNSYRFVYLDRNNIEISNLLDCGKVDLYDVNGKLAGKYNVVDGKCLINLSDKANGVYIVKAGNKPAVKIIK